MCDTKENSNQSPAETAADTLREIEELRGRTQRASSAGVLGPCLVLSGLCWLLTLGTAHFAPTYAWLVGLLAGLACGGGILLRIQKERRTGAVLSEQAVRLQRRALLFWALLFAQGLALLWVSDLSPAEPRPFITFFILISMLGFMATGLFLSRTILVLMGLGISLLCVLGNLLFPPQWFFLWNALVIGLGMIACGQHIWSRWK